MKIQPYVERLSGSKEFKDFSQQYKDAFMVAGFFVIDFESNKNLHQLDYYVPSKKKIAAFTMDKGVTMQLLETVNQKVPEKLDMKASIDLDALHGILLDEMKNRSITEDIKKMIAILQNINGKKVWNINCVLSGMEILRAHVEDESKTVLKMEKASIMDYVKKISPDALKAMAKGGPAGSATTAPAKENPKEKLKQIEILEKQLEIEKEKATAELKGPEKQAKASKTVKVKKK